MFCKYPQLNKFIKWQLKTTAGQTLYRTLSLPIYGGGNIYLDRDMENPGRSDHFPEGTGCMSWFFIMSAGTKLKCAFNNSSVNSKTKFLKLKNLIYAFFKGCIYTQEISAILTINAPKWRQSAANCGNMAISELCIVFFLISMCI